MNNLQIFNNIKFGQIRVLMMEEGEPWFVGKDITDILEYQNGRDALLKHIDIKDKTSVAIHDGSQNRNMTIINESGLYSLIMSSKLKAAKKFKRWVTSEVLPSIRKHGLYATEKTIDEILTNPDFGIRLLEEIKKEREEKKQLQAQLKKDKPYTNFAKAIASSSDCITIGEFAKICNNNGIKIGRNRLFDWLRNNGYLIRYGKERNNPKQQYIEQGLFQLIERTIISVGGDLIRTTTLMTGKGQMYFLGKLKETA